MGKDVQQQPIRSYPAPIFQPTEQLTMEPNRRALDWAMRELSRVLKSAEQRRSYGGVEFSVVFADGVVQGDVRVRNNLELRV